MTHGPLAAQQIRWRVRCEGRVQGVGFRPTVYAVAQKLELRGWVRNDRRGVVLEVEGRVEDLEAFESTLRAALPPLATLTGLVSREVALGGDVGFRVEESDLGGTGRVLPPADAVVCDACLAELRDPENRRFGHPFTLCTHCGPRFTVVRDLPYDRERTSMAVFPLCPECQAEYADPADRRFHAEPVCCPACGPRLQWQDATGGGVVSGAVAVDSAVTVLNRGGIVALKGVGGYQLACSASDEDAVRRLRRRKRRPSQPLAVMVRDLERARSLVRLSEDDAALLGSARGPIVLAPFDAADLEGQVADSVAPGLTDLGVMLPTTPLHHRLLDAVRGGALVMTSGNRSGEPLCAGLSEVRAALGDVADGFLSHDREVVHRVDDSVVRADPAGAFLVRRARGWVPEPLPVPCAPVAPVWAVGGHLQVTAALALAEGVVLTQHVGDLETEAARQFLARAVSDLESLVREEPAQVAVDAHPDYPSAAWGRHLARQRGGEVVEVQHHVAHAAAVLAEHGRFPEVDEQVGAVVLDGTGYGPDGTSWGGELLLVRGTLEVSRVAHLEPLPLVGGERAVREPWRVALGALATTSAAPLLEGTPMARHLDPVWIRAVYDLARAGVGTTSTGAGRVFEAAGALLGLAVENRWEGEAAARLEALATTGRPGRVWTSVMESPPPAVGVLPSRRLLQSLVRRQVAGNPRAELAADFHATFAALVARLVEQRLPADVRWVAAAGGCLVNRLLRAALRGALEQQGRRLLLPQRVPAGDGGLSYGQAVVAVVSGVRGMAPRFDGVDPCV